MTDKVIFNDAGAQRVFSRSQRMVSVPDASPLLMTNYLFSVDSDTSSIPKAYRGFILGNVWTEFAAGSGNQFRPAKMSIWYDRWTIGDETGNNVHIVWSHSGAGTGVYYNKFRTDNNTVTLNHVAINTSLPNDPVGDSQIEIIKNENGDLWISIWQNGAAGSFFQLHKSEDDGVSWSLVFSAGPTQNMILAGVNFDGIKQIIMCNAPGTPDETTPYFILYDAATAASSTNSVVLASFNGTTLVSRLIIDNDVENTVGHIYVGITAALRHADRRLFIIYQSAEHNDVNNTLRVRSLTTPTSVTTHFDLLSVADLAGDIVTVPQLTIDQVRGTLYVGYLRGSAFFGNVSVYWNKSINSAFAWAGELLSTDGGDRDFRAIGMPDSVGDIDEISQIFLAAYDDDTNDWLVSDDDLIIIGAYTVRGVADGGSEQEIVDCQTGNPTGGNCISACPPPFLGTTKPLYGGDGDQAFITYSGKGPGVFKVGQKVIGLRSGATGIFAGKHFGLKRALITDIKRGPRGYEFLPNERLQVVDRSTTWLTLHKIVATSKNLRLEKTDLEIA